MKNSVFFLSNDKDFLMQNKNMLNNLMKMSQINYLMCVISRVWAPYMTYFSAISAIMRIKKVRGLFNKLSVIVSVA